MYLRRPARTPVGRLGQEVLDLRPREARSSGSGRVVRVPDHALVVLVLVLLVVVLVLVLVLVSGSSGGRRVRMACARSVCARGRWW